MTTGVKEDGNREVGLWDHLPVVAWSGQTYVDVPSNSKKMGDMFPVTPFLPPTVSY